MSFCAWSRTGRSPAFSFPPHDDGRNAEGKSVPEHPSGLDAHPSRQERVQWFWWHDRVHVHLGDLPLTTRKANQKVERDEQKQIDVRRAEHFKTCPFHHLPNL